MLKLFSVLLGGRAERCNMELHDMVFVIGNTIDATYAQLVNKWFGIRKGLHIDAFAELRWIDGHEVCIERNKPAENAKKLFFVNFGGYQPGYFGEMHEVSFYVASSKSEALVKAKKELAKSLLAPHCDDNVSIDDIMKIEQADGYYIHLRPTLAQGELNIVTKYLKLDIA